MDAVGTKAPLTSTTSPSMRPLAAEDCAKMLFDVATSDTRKSMRNQDVCAAVANTMTSLKEPLGNNKT